jgi:hypothetical protein
MKKIIDWRNKMSEKQLHIKLKNDIINEVYGMDCNKWYYVEDFKLENPYDFFKSGKIYQIENDSKELIYVHSSKVEIKYI